VFARSAPDLLLSFLLPPSQLPVTAQALKPTGWEGPPALHSDNLNDLPQTHTGTHKPDEHAGKPETITSASTPLRSARAAGSAPRRSRAERARHAAEVVGREGRHGRHREVAVDVRLPAPQHA